MIQCVGCGGRNQPDAQECEWCARPFREEPADAYRWWQLAALLVAALVVVIVLGLAALSLTAPETAARRSAATPGATASPVLAGPEPPAARRTPLPRSSQAEIARTDGQGASLRREPAAQAERITVLPEGSVVRIVGPEVLEDDSAWVEVQDAQGNRGWVQSDLVRPLPDTPVPEQ